ncbi:hypothetical protein [Streptomyces sp. W1SF4]|uniref:hypothetical protein n=1 Tax=Streptomyces sp. W1SF4 TaxID=2305220 RepID=UPI000F6FA2D2|nr:hypothetical protein [Streptomyces sp. W1SF4]AZM93862.1 hypothetical protein D1J60_35730 [Streptomyces sp. W1SF4]
MLNAPDAEVLHRVRLRPRPPQQAAPAPTCGADVPTPPKPRRSVNHRDADLRAAPRRGVRLHAASAAATAVPAEKGAAGDIDWLVSVGSTIVRAHQHVVEGFRGHLGSVTMEVRRRSEGGMSEGGNVPEGQRSKPEQVGPAPWLALACLVGLVLAYVVLTNFTAELRAALWGEPGTVTGADCRTYDNTVANAGTSTSCSGAFTPDGGGSSFEVPVEGDVDVQPVRAWLVDGTSGTAYVSPTLWAGVVPVGLSLLLAGFPAAVTVKHVRRVHAQRPGEPPHGPRGRTPSSMGRSPRRGVRPPWTSRRGSG